MRPRCKPGPGPPGVGSRCTDTHVNTAGLHAPAETERGPLCYCSLRVRVVLVALLAMLRTALAPRCVFAAKVGKASGEAGLAWRKFVKSCRRVARWRRAYRCSCRRCGIGTRGGKPARARRAGCAAGYAEDCSESVDQWVSGGRSSHGARRLKQLAEVVFRGCQFGMLAAPPVVPSCSPHLRGPSGLEFWFYTPPGTPQGPFLQQPRN
jgi:hypothetical protein